MPQWIKKWLSYFFEIPVEESSSDINPYLEVAYKNNRYLLSTKNAVYSYEDNYTTYRIAFEQIKPTQFKPENILILGYGLGSIPLILYKKHQIRAHYSAVEIDPEVIRLAQLYGKIPDGVTVEFICQDAIEFVKQTSQKFDMICMDIFLDNLVPLPFESKEYLENLKEILSPGGWLLYNRLYYNSELQSITDAFFEHQFKDVFPEATSIDTVGNKMLVYQKPSK